MDYVDGSDTAQLLHHSPNGLPTTDVCELACAVADAIDYAHGNGLLHRDIKPSNVLVSQRKAGKRRILLTDFGIARRLDDINGLTATNMTVGTVNYAAPERSIQRHRGDSHTQHGKHFGAAPVEQGFGVSSACQAR